MIAYKLLRKRKDGTLGPLFINRKQVIKLGKWLKAESHPTTGFKFRPGWHCCHSPKAPHLSKKGRVWCKVIIDKYETLNRPKSQGGIWYLCKKMQILHEL
jgi:hypothetical protein